MSQACVGITYQQSMALIGQAKLCYAWVKVCPEGGVYMKITKAQARYSIHLARSKFNDANILARLDQDGDLLIN